MALKKSVPANDSSSGSSLSQELLNQFQNNFTATPAPVQETAASEPVSPAAAESVPAASAKKPNYKNIFNVHMGTGDKARLKTFCAAREVPINTFILYAIEHLIEEIEDGKCSVSKSGIRMIKKDD